MGGGVNKPYGEYDSSIQLIESELFDLAGFEKLYIAGHPEGNKDIDPDGSTKNIDQALLWKNEYKNRTDADMAITTQFCFDSKTVINWANDIKNKGVDIPIHIGIAGPAKLQTLLRYSIECGVGASIKILQKRALDLTKLLLPYKPTKILDELAIYKFNNPDFNIEKVHFFPLGGVKQHPQAQSGLLTWVGGGGLVPGGRGWLFFSSPSLRSQYPLRVLDVLLLLRLLLLLLLLVLL